jgi:hypothetical protein
MRWSLRWCVDRAHATKQILYSLSMTGVLAGWLKTDRRNPKLDRAKCKVIGIARSVDIFPIIDHPSQLDRGELR